MALASMRMEPMNSSLFASRLALDLLDGLLDLVAHLVEGVGQDAHLVVALHGDARGVVAAGQAAGAAGQLLDGPADLAREQRAEARWRRWSRGATRASDW